MLALVATAACGGGESTDTAREIELAPADSGAAMSDTAATPAAAPTPAPAAARICTNTHKVGDRFTPTTTADVAATNGVTIPTGSEVTLEVVESARGQNGRDNVKLAFKPVSITVRGRSSDLSADVTRVATLEYDRVQSNTTQAGKVAAGAAVGAIAGQVLGRNTKSTVAGAAVGAAAGGVVAAATTDFDGCLAQNAALTITLTQQLTVN